jgi:hypothetical protein
MALNALSALGMQDIVKRYVKKELSGRMELVLSKLLTVFWGCVRIFFTFFVAYGAGYLISLAFPKPDSARLEGTLFQAGRASLKALQKNWQPYYVTLALYGTGILVLLVVMTYVV